MESRISTNWPWVVIAIVLGIGAIALIAASTAPSNGFYGMMGNGAWGWGILMIGIPALILIVVLLAVLGVYREPTTAVFYPAYVSQSANALHALEQRYARGELSREDYLRIRADLTHGPTGT